MSDERRVEAWFAETATALDDVRVERTLSGRDVRRRSAGRRRRRVLAGAVAAVGVVAFGAATVWNVTRPERSAVEPAHPREGRDMERAQEKLRAYYSGLPEALASRRPAQAAKLSKLMAVHFTETALRNAMVSKRKGADGLAATCGRVTADTVFTVGEPRRTGAGTVRARVVNSSGPVAIDVDFDVRAMKISKWSCPGGS
ncbi:hypothetical protein [Streptomyces sp. 5-10]|uniref:hypothetical protein n=1 Tax=Streptomyces sp. 5-10 TaxID=878925 RepID=UPI00168AA964|nr:hypothetical protein [Streptomyces sp. 5-10]MBD3010366.1 hypothetical protein [Streptomyces sp. 5-10]